MVEFLYKGKIRRIQDLTCEVFEVSHTDLLSQRRHKRITIPRQFAMFLCMELTQASLVKIGQSFHRDHTTVMHAVKRVQEYVNRSSRYASLCNQIKERFLVMQEAENETPII